MEIYKDILGYEGLYQVSNLGNVKSFKLGREKLLKSALNKYGYLYVSLHKDSISKTKFIHQLVAESFLNHIPNGRVIVVNHIDFNRKNNSLFNLELVSFRENTNKKHLKSSSKYTGVCWFANRKKWLSTIRINNKAKYLGLFENEYDAHLAYEKALKDLLNQSEV